MLKVRDGASLSEHLLPSAEIMKLSVHFEALSVHFEALSVLDFQNSVFPANAATAALVAAGENAGATDTAAVCLDFGDNVAGNGDTFAAQVLKRISCRHSIQTSIIRCKRVGICLVIGILRRLCVSRICHRLLRIPPFPPLPPTWSY